MLRINWLQYALGKLRQPEPDLMTTVVIKLPVQHRGRRNGQKLKVNIRKFVKVNVKRKRGY